MNWGKFTLTKAWGSPWGRGRTGANWRDFVGVEKAWNPLFAANDWEVWNGVDSDIVCESETCTDFWAWDKSGADTELDSNELGIDWGIGGKTDGVFESKDLGIDWGIGGKTDGVFESKDLGIDWGIGGKTDGVFESKDLGIDWGIGGKTDGVFESKDLGIDWGIGGKTDGVFESKDLGIDWGNNCSVWETVSKELGIDWEIWEVCKGVDKIWGVLKFWNELETGADCNGRVEICKDCNIGCEIWGDSKTETDCGSGWESCDGIDENWADPKFCVDCDNGWEICDDWNDWVCGCAKLWTDFWIGWFNEIGICELWNDCEDKGENRWLPEIANPSNCVEVNCPLRGLLSAKFWFCFNTCEGESNEEVWAPLYAALIIAGTNKTRKKFFSI